MDTERIAACSCGSLTATCRGEPVRVSVCHCLDCRRRSGSVFSSNATFAADQVSTAGAFSTFTRSSDEGRWARFNFCPTCGATVFYEIEVRPGMITVPVGAFADPGFPEPHAEVYGGRRSPWVRIEPDGPIHRD